MTATILSFGRRQPNTPPLPAKMPWQNQDLAELYRVRDRLCAAGLDVEVEAGVTDEGDPWFVYVQAGTDNVVVHIARIDSEIHVINCVTGGTYTGTSFREVSDRMLEDAPLALSTQVRRGSNVVLHPSAFLTAFVAAAIMLVDLLEHGRAEAATTHDGASVPDGTHGHFLFEAKSASDDAGSAGAAALGAETVQANEAPDGVGSRRIAKEASATGLSVVNLGPVAPTGPVGVASALPIHVGFLAEVPGVGASVTLAAGILAAEFARSFASEEKHSSGEATGSSFVHEFASLLTAFVSVESAHAKSLPIDVAKDGAVLPVAAPSTSVEVHAAPAVHVEVAPSSTIGATLSVKSALDGVVEHAVFSPSITSPALPAQKSSAPSATPAPQTMTVATTDTNRTVGSSSESSAASVPTPATVAVQTSAASSSAGVNSTKADVVKDAAALDLGWVVSQLVKHDAAGSLVQKSVSVGSSELTIVLKDGTKDQAGGEASSSHADSPTTGGIKLPGGTSLSVTSSADSGKTDLVKVLPTKGQATSDAGSHGDVSKTAGHETTQAQTDVTTLTPAGGTITLEAGQHETIVYKAGSTLVLQGFVFGEDYLSFDGKLGDAMAAKAHADGVDLVLGDTDTGTVRLVGVLADPDLLSHHGGTQATAA